MPWKIMISDSLVNCGHSLTILKWGNELAQNGHDLPKTREQHNQILTWHDLTKKKYKKRPGINKIWE